MYEGKTIRVFTLISDKCRSQSGKNVQVCTDILEHFLVSLSKNPTIGRFFDKLSPVFL